MSHRLVLAFLVSGALLAFASPSQAGHHHRKCKAAHCAVPVAMPVYAAPVMPVYTYAAPVYVTPAPQHIGMAPVYPTAYYATQASTRPVPVSAYAPTMYVVPVRR
jgi:hypothetical protein